MFFEQIVPRNGFTWVEGGGTDTPAPPKGHIPRRDWYLVPDLESGAFVFNPMQQYTGLFRTLAGTPPTTEGILAFAKQYGMLGVEPSWLYLPTGVPGQVHPRSCESLTAWQKAIYHLCAVVRLWEDWKARNLAALSSSIVWDEHGGVSYTATTEPPWQLGMRWQLIAAPHYNNDLLRQFVPGDVIGPALAVLHTFINRELEATTPQLRCEKHTSQYTLGYCPKTLLSACWLQFALAVTQAQSFRQCAMCPTWFAVGGTRQSRTDKLFCSNRCKTAYYRARGQNRPTAPVGQA